VVSIKCHVFFQLPPFREAKFDRSQAAIAGRRKNGEALLVVHPLIAFILAVKKILPITMG